MGQIILDISYTLLLHAPPKAKLVYPITSRPLWSRSCGMSAPSARSLSSNRAIWSRSCAASSAASCKQSSNYSCAVSAAKGRRGLVRAKEMHSRRRCLRNGGWWWAAGSKTSSLPCSSRTPPGLQRAPVPLLEFLPVNGRTLKISRFSETISI